MQREKLKRNNGITLIALIITIIVMLILVAVTVSVALNGGLFSTAKDAANRTQIEADREELLSAVVAALKTDGTVDFSKLPPSGWTGSDGTYTSPNGNEFIVKEDGEIIDNGENGEIIELPEGWSKTDKPEGWDNDKVIAVTDGTNIIPLPEGFEISNVDGEHTVEEGLVIKDGANEFVWIPCPNEYIEESFEPLKVMDYTSKCVYDSQGQLDYYYGEGYFDYANDFNYAQDKINIETSINKYKGFYVGRYETTIDENGTIGSMKNKTVLTSFKTIVQTNDKYVRWYGLYKVQKDMYKENESVFSTMITSKEWDVIMDFTGYGSAKRATATYTTSPDLSGSAYKDSNPEQYDVSKNIYDLAGNVRELTLKSVNPNGRVERGGGCSSSGLSASYSTSIYPFGVYSDTR